MGRHDTRRGPAGRARALVRVNRRAHAPALRFWLMYHSLHRLSPSTSPYAARNLMRFSRIAASQYAPVLRRQDSNLTRLMEARSVSTGGIDKPSRAARAAYTCSSGSSSSSGGSGSRIGSGSSGDSGSGSGSSDSGRGSSASRSRSSSSCSSSRSRSSGSSSRSSSSSSRFTSWMPCAIYNRVWGYSAW